MEPYRTYANGDSAKTFLAVSRDTLKYSFVEIALMQWPLLRKLNIVCPKSWQFSAAKIRVR